MTGFLLTVFAFLICANVARGQSGDPAAPAPLASNSADGRVEPLDIGDSRLTRHYYVFSAGPGDLIVNVESVNLNGDVDLFAANGLRPLVKVSVFAGSFSGGADKISKSIFLRRQESIVLRVEGRAAGDEAARYRISFEGPFVAAAAAPATNDEKPASTVAEAPRTGTRRVNSVGARIEEPTPPPNTATERPVAAAPARDEKAATVETPAPPIAPPRAATAPRRTTAPRPRASRRRAPPAADTTSSSAPERVTTKPAAKADEPPPAATAPPKPVISTAKPPVPAAAVGVRLVVELRDGERLERQMSEVRRVTVERGVLIVVGGDGRTERRPMSQVLRMAIE